MSAKNLNSLFFSNEGILPSSETPEISSSVRITMLSDELAEEDALVILNKGLLSFIQIN